MLIERLRVRYSDFKQNTRFYSLLGDLRGDKRSAHVRYLEPGNPKSAHKPFFNPNILEAFDGHYTRR
jgi:hypothetical protein